MTQLRSLRSVALLAGLAMWCASSAMPGAAQSGPARGPALNWVRLSGAESCIAPVELAQRIEQRLGHRVLVRATDAIIVIEGRVGPDPKGGFTTVIRVSDADGALFGTREFSVPNADCHKLDELVTLVMAITIHHQDGASAGIALPPQIVAQLDALFADEASTFEAQELQPAAPRAPSQDTVPPTVVRAGEPVTKPGLVFAFGIEAGFGLATGLQPTATFGPRLRARASVPDLGSLALGVAVGLPQRQNFAAEHGARLEYIPGQLGLSACPPAWTLWASELTLCADLRVAGIRVAASQFSRNETNLALWPEVAVSASARSRLWGPSYLHLQFGVPLRLARPDFRYVDSQGAQRPAFRVARFGIELELGVGLAF